MRGVAAQVPLRLAPVAGRGPGRNLLFRWGGRRGAYCGEGSTLPVIPVGGEGGALRQVELQVVGQLLDGGGFVGGDEDLLHPGVLDGQTPTGRGGGGERPHRFDRFGGV